MATFTFRMDLAEDEWVQLTTGEISGNVGLFYESNSEGSIGVCIANTPPTPEEINYIMMGSDIYELHLDLELEQTVYLCGKGGPAVVRGYKLPGKRL